MSPERPEPLKVVLDFVGTLEDLELPCHVGGSHASSIHGSARQTQNVDLVVDMDLAAIPALVDRLQDAYYYDRRVIRDAVLERTSFNLVHYASAFKIDVFVR
jgi:hypothetical protein